jgi:hypothetical protein
VFGLQQRQQGGPSGASAHAYSRVLSYIGCASCALAVYAVVVIPRGPSSILQDGYQHPRASRLEGGQHAAGSTGADGDGVTRRSKREIRSPSQSVGIQKGKKNGKINTGTCRLEMPSDVHLSSTVHTRLGYASRNHATSPPPPS